MAQITDDPILDRQLTGKAPLDEENWPSIEVNTIKDKADESVGGLGKNDPLPFAKEMPKDESPVGKVTPAFGKEDPLPFKLMPKEEFVIERAQTFGKEDPLPFKEMSKVEPPVQKVTPVFGRVDPLPFNQMPKEETPVRKVYPQKATEIQEGIAQINKKSTELDTKFTDLWAVNREIEKKFKDLEHQEKKQLKEAADLNKKLDEMEKSVNQIDKDMTAFSNNEYTESLKIPNVTPYQPIKEKEDPEQTHKKKSRDNYCACVIF